MNAGLRSSRLRRVLLIGAVFLAVSAGGPGALAAPVPPPPPPPNRQLPEGPWPPSQVLAADPATVPPPSRQLSPLAVGCPAAPSGVLRTAPGAGKTVALTFDDGPGPSTDQLLQVLNTYSVAATFFNIGVNETVRPATVQAEANQGFVLGNHTWSHPDMSTLPADQQAAEMDNAINEQLSLTGTRPCFFRPPYGSYNSTTLSLAQARNMAVYNWSVDTLDWEARGSADQSWVNQIVSLAEAGSSQAHPVILFHNQPVGSPATVAALPTIITYYRSLGYTFVDLAGGVRGQDPTRRDISPVGVAAARTSLGTTLAFVRGTDGALYMTTGTSAGFGGYQRIPAGTLSGPAAVSGDGHHVDLFVVGTDRALWHTASDTDAQGRPGAFGTWQSLGGTLTTAPAVASSAPGTILVTGRGTDGSLWARAWDGTSWTAWRPLGGRAISAPAADVVDAGTYRVLVVGTDGAVWQQPVSAAAVPGGWSTTGAATSFAPAASATAGWARDIRALAFSSGAGVRQVWANGTAFDIGGAVTSAVALAEFGGTTTWTFARGTDNALWLDVATAAGSTYWVRIGGTLA